uniref:uncharacterized protein si:ch211-13f8.1 isoform X2 n=1 Tax=Monopterus albus TaxID=43700 RepID=UPI0009B2EFCB|nr:uncharacterized protein KIAA1614 homolog isoform X2 [Monopterus albus]
MEEEKEVDNIQAKSSSPLPIGFPINWGLITGPVPQPVLPAPSLSTQLPPQSSAVHAQQIKVTKSLTQRRTRGRDREKDRERLDTDMVGGSSPAEQVSSELPLRQRRRGKGQVSLAEPSGQSGAVKNLSSSDEEEEVEVQVRLESHSPPAEAQGKHMFQRGEETQKERSERNKGQVSFQTSQSYGLGEGTSLKGLLSDNSSNSKDEPSLPSPPPALSSCSAATSASTTFSSSSSMSGRHWAPPKGFWRVACPETLLLNGVGPHNIPSTLPLKDYTQTGALAEPQKKSKPAETGTRGDVGGAVVESNESSKVKHSDRVGCYLDRCEQEIDAGDPAKGLCRLDSWQSLTSQSGMPSADEKMKVKQRAYAMLREKQQDCKEVREQNGEESARYCGDRTLKVGSKACVRGVLDISGSVGLEPHLSDELPLSPRHEQAKRLLERARLKARFSHVKADHPCRCFHFDQRTTVNHQQVESPSPTPVKKAVQTEEDLTAQIVSGPLLIPTQRDASPGDQGGQSRRYGCSPTRVRFEDESDKEVESRYLDRVRQRGRPGVPKSSSSGTERSRRHRSVSMPPSQKQEDICVSGETTTVIKEIVVLVKKCEACGSIVREPQSIISPSDPQNNDPQQSGNSEDAQGKPVHRWEPPIKPEANICPKAPLTVTFAGAYVLGENEESNIGWKASGFGKLRRRSRKGESHLESGHGPYGPSWAQRRNSNPRNRVNLNRAVSFAPGSPIALELKASCGLRESPTQSFPIKSALKSSSRNRSATGQSTVQFQFNSNQGGDGGSPYSVFLDSPETKREFPMTVTQGTSATSSPVPCIRPCTLKYSPARVNPDMPTVETWDATPDGTGLRGDHGSGPEFRSQALSRAEDLRAELLRAEHLKAEFTYEENSDGSRKLDGWPKIFLRHFFSSIGLNSVGRLVKGGQSSSMEQLSTPSTLRASFASPSIQRTPSLQTLHTVLPLAQLHKASSVQGLERRTERSTILGEVPIPYGLAPSPDSPRLELHRALSVENVRTSRTVHPVGRIIQAFPDGTLLLELIRPPNGPFGFVISRGKGRPNAGVYVEKAGDGSGEGPYIGLLGIGDEILEVNGEAVAGLSLDQVTRLMTRESIASLRIMPAPRNQR